MDSPRSSGESAGSAPGRPDNPIRLQPRLPVQRVVPVPASVTAEQRRSIEDHIVGLHQALRPHVNRENAAAVAEAAVARPARMGFQAGTGGLKGAIERHPHRAQFFGIASGAALAFVCPHAALVYYGAHLLGHGTVAFHMAMGSTSLIGGTAGRYGADLVAKGRESDIIQMIGEEKFTEEQIKRWQAAALAAPVGASMVLVPGVGAIWVTGHVASVPLGSAAMAGAGAGAGGAAYQAHQHPEELGFGPDVEVTPAPEMTAILQEIGHHELPALDDPRRS